MVARLRYSVVPAIAAVSTLVAAVLVIDVLAILGVVRARREAVSVAESEISIRAELEARTIEAALSSARADLGVLAATGILHTDEPTDPMTARRLRLERESALLLYAVGHPVLDEIVLERDGAQVVRIGRVGAEPVVLAPGSSEIAGPLRARVEAGPRGAIVARAGGRATLALLDSATGSVALLPANEPTPPPRAEELLASATFVLPGWLPERGYRLERREPRRAVLLRVERLAANYRQTLAIHLALMILSVLLAAFALRGIRRTARLAAERAVAEQRRTLERQMWHADRLASVGRLAAGIAHEINNPLAGITTWLTLLEEDIVGGDRDGAKATVAKLRQGVERIRDVVGSTLTFAAPGRGPFEEVDLGAVVRETAVFVEALEEDFTVELSLAEPALVVSGDRRALGQLVLNVLINSAQAQSPSGGASARLSRQGDEAVLVIEDEGPGIPAEVLGRLFEPFASGRGSAGLGLAVCHGIVRAHAGSIRGENRPEGGARFTITLPLRSAGAPA